MRIAPLDISNPAAHQMPELYRSIRCTAHDAVLVEVNHLAPAGLEKQTLKTARCSFHWGFPKNIRTWSVRLEILLRFLTCPTVSKEVALQSKALPAVPCSKHFHHVCQKCLSKMTRYCAAVKKPRKSFHCSHFVTALSEERLRNSAYQSSEKHANHRELMPSRRLDLGRK